MRRPGPLPAFVVPLMLMLGTVPGCRESSPPPGPGAAATTPTGDGARDPVRFVPDDPALVRRNNRGVGLMGRFAYEEARSVFAELVAEHPQWLDVKVNLAIATLNRQKDGDEEMAATLLREALEADPEHLRAMFCLALLEGRAGQPEAVALYRRVYEADPQDAYAAYYYASALEMHEQPEDAIALYRRAIELDPYLRSSYYRAGQILLRSGRREEGKALLDEFVKLEGNPRASTTDTVYTKLGPKGMTVAVDLRDADPGPPPSGPVFLDPRALGTGDDPVTWNAEPSARPASVTACDIDDDGHLDLFITDALRQPAGARNALLRGRGDGSFFLDTDHVLASVPDVNAALWGDYDNDGRTDVFLCRRGPNHLWRQAGPDQWEQIATASGAAGAEVDTVDGAMVDADHDGDLDIFCVNADGPNELLNNNLDGSFRPLAAEQGLAGDGRPSRQVVFTDLDHDRDLDLVVINESPPHEVYLNDRLWQYRPADGAEAFTRAGITAAVAADLEADGTVDLITAARDGTLVHWTIADSGWHGARLAMASASGRTVHSLGIADVNGDARPELVVNDSDGWRVLDRDGTTRHRADGGLHGFALAMIDPVHGPAAVGWAPGNEPRWWPAGPGRHGFAALSLSGREDAGQSMRSNASGIGTFVVARMGSSWSTTSTLRHDSGPGQSLQAVAIGLGGNDEIDYVLIDWPDGLFQSELALAGSEVHAIAETQRQVSSCPVLFTWNGERFEFVSDLLGVGGVGYMVAPGEYAPPRPWEHFLIPDGRLAPRGDRYVLKLSEPMEEACYLDWAQLVAYDLPPGWDMTLDERMGIGDPAPSGRPRFFRRHAAPVHAINDRGGAVTAALGDADHVAAPVGSLDHRFLGRLDHDHVLTLRFDVALDGPRGVPTLVIDGWVEYPYSQTMFAAWQAGATYRAPTLEAQASDGTWHVILKEFGYPAGMPRQMSVPLADLPTGCTALRLSTNQEIYWDRIAIAWAEPCPEVRRETLGLAEARLLRSGFARRETGPQRLPLYAYQDRAPLWDTRHQRGFYTAFGPVEPLLADADDAVAIFGPGEEVHVEFSAPGKRVEDGWTRRLVLEVAGWCKDMDLFTQDGETLEPIPTSGRGGDARRRLHETFNTRLEAGR